MLMLQVVGFPKPQTLWTCTTHLWEIPVGLEGSEVQGLGLEELKGRFLNLAGLSEESVTIATVIVTAIVLDLVLFFLAS